MAKHRPRARGGRPTRNATRKHGLEISADTLGYSQRHRMVMTSRAKQRPIMFCH